MKSRFNTQKNTKKSKTLTKTHKKKLLKSKRLYKSHKKTHKKKILKSKKSTKYPNNILYIEDKPDCKKLYCGRSRQLPKGYTHRGDPFECLRKGFGAGKSQGEGKIIVRPGDLIDLDLKGLRFIAKSKKIKKIRDKSKKELITRIINKSHIC
jgi:hypothetical protein